MKLELILSLLQTLLPVAEGIASIYIHNPGSANKFTMIVGAANELEPLAAALASLKPAAK